MHSLVIVVFSFDNPSIGNNLTKAYLNIKTYKFVRLTNCHN